MHKSGIILVKGEERNEALKATKQILDCNGERPSWIHTQSKGRGRSKHHPPTYDNRWNRLKLAFQEQDKIGWDNLIKGRMVSALYRVFN
jgi:hypothetical protein